MSSGIRPQGEQFYGTMDRELQSRADREFSKQLEDNPTLDGRLIEGVNLIVGTNVISHRLGRQLRGWWVTRRYDITGALTSVDLSEQSAPDSRYLRLTSSVVQTVDLWVF